MKIPMRAIRNLAGACGMRVEAVKGKGIKLTMRRKGVREPFRGMYYTSQRAFMHVLYCAMYVSRMTREEVVEAVDWSPRILRSKDVKAWDLPRDDASLNALMSRVWRNQDLNNNEG